eukprot:1923032-Pleurochrysis_carterae.AAC.1
MCNRVRPAARMTSCMSAAKVIDRRATHAGTVVMSPKKVADQRRKRDCLDRALEMAIGAVDSQVWKE